MYSKYRQWLGEQQDTTPIERFGMRDTGSLCNMINIRRLPALAQTFRLVRRTYAHPGSPASLGRVFTELKPPFYSGAEEIKQNRWGKGEILQLLHTTNRIRERR